MRKLALLLVPFLFIHPAQAGSPEQALVEKLKRLGEVHPTYGGEGKDKTLTGVDFRITGDRPVADVIAAVRELAKLPTLESVLLLGPAFTADAVKELEGSKIKRLTLFNTS